MDPRDRGVAVTGGGVLVVAGTDSSGGAGLVRDVATLAGLGVPVCAAVTAVTAQSDGRVWAVEAMPASIVASQMEAAFAGGTVAAVKIGMLADAGIAEAVAARLERHPGVPVVLDPVLCATSGGRLTDAAGLAVLCRRLLPLALLATPNRDELAALAGAPPAESEAEAMAQAARLLAAGAQNVLVKGGHMAGARGTDILCRQDGGRLRFEGSERPGSVRGTGCALSSAIAGHLAKGADLPTALHAARAVVRALFDDPASASPPTRAVR